MRLFEQPKLAGYVPEKGVQSRWGRYRPLLLESLAQALAGEHLPRLADLHGPFRPLRQKRRHTSRTRPCSGSLGEVSHGDHIVS
jgi:hypothetical protein